MKKLTNKEIVSIIKDFFETVEIDMDEEVKAGILKYCDTQLISMDKKAEREKIRNANKAPKEDSILPIVQSVITEEFQDMPEILNVLAENGYGDLTRQKVASRISKLVADGIVEKKITRSQNHVSTRYRLMAA